MKTATHSALLTKVFGAAMAVTSLDALAVEAPPACGTPLPLAQLTYQIFEDGKKRGEATATLAPEPDGVWRFHVASRARAGILRGTAVEQSSFEWVNGMPRPRNYERRFSVGPFSRVSTATFDWSTAMASGTYKGDDWTLEIETGDVDRLLLQLASARALVSEPKEVKLRYVDRGGYRELFDDSLTSESIQTRSGDRWTTTRIDRTRGKRITRTWHAKEAGMLPVRIEHEDQKDDEILLLDLTDIQWLPCPDATPPPAP